MTDDLWDCTICGAQHRGWKPDGSPIPPLDSDVRAKLIDVGLRYKRERDEARRQARRMNILVIRAAPFVNAVAVVAEDKTQSLKWLADASRDEGGAS